MAKGYVGNTTGTAINGGNITLTLNSGLNGGSGSAVSAGDIVFVFGSCGSINGTPGWPGGWTVIDNGVNSANTRRCILAYKVMGGTPDTSVQFTGDGDSGSSMHASAHVFSGAAYDSTAGAATATGNSTNPNPAALTPSQANSAIITFVMSAGIDSIKTPSTNYTELLDGSACQSTGDANDVATHVQWRDGLAASSQDPDAITGWGTGSYRAVTIAIKEATTAYTLAADPGSYVITGSAANLKAGRKIAAAAGVYAITGSAANLKVGRKIAAAFGTYTITGSPAALKADRKLAAAFGVYSITGSAAGLSRGQKIAAAPGSYSITGSAANLKAGRRIAAAPGVYTITGFDADLIPPAAGYTLAADPGTYAVTGSAASLRAARKIAAAPGAYTVTGSPAALRTSRAMVAAPGVYTITGFDAALSVGGAPPGPSGVTGRQTSLPVNPGSLMNRK